MNMTDNCALVTTEQGLGAVLKTQKTVLVLIYATWCPFCVRFLPIFKKYAEGRASFLFAQDNEESIADKYEVEVVPTVIFFENGEVSKRLDGVLGVGLNEKLLVDFISKCNLLDI